MPEQSGVEVFSLPPNTTAGFEPTDAGTVANSKALYRHHGLDRLLIKLENTPWGGEARNNQI